MPAMIARDQQWLDVPPGLRAEIAEDVRACRVAIAKVVE
jgi:hypothetical protein